MTLKEAIKNAEAVAEENQRVVDTGIVFDDVTIDMLYCDDTEVIEEHLANYQERAEEYRQIAELLKDYERLLEQESILDKIKAEITDTGAFEKETMGQTAFLNGINYCLGVIDRYRAEADCHECKVEYDCYECKRYVKSEE